MWTYMTHGPFKDLPELSGWMRATCLGDDPLVHAIVDGATGKATGVASFMRSDPAAGVIEVGSIPYPPRLQRPPAATAAMMTEARRGGKEGGRPCRSRGVPY